jgi:hypothetical protein
MRGLLEPDLVGMGGGGIDEARNAPEIFGMDVFGDLFRSHP